MFCQNCGKEISNDTKFCSYCGAPQNAGSAQNAGQAPNTGQASNAGQTYGAGAAPGMNMQPKPPKKKKNWVLRIVIPLAAFGVAFGIGYCATGAYKLKRPTAFETLSPLEFDVPKSPSIKTETEETAADGYVNHTEETVTDGDGNITGNVLDKKTYFVDTEAVKSKIFFNYTEDGTVCSVSGSISYYDLSLVDIINDLRSDARYAKEFLMEMDAPPSCYVTLLESTESVNLTFVFDGLQDDSDMAELTAAFIGFEAENGKIMIDSANEEMLGFGYALE